MDLSHNNTGYFPAMPVCDKHLSTELNSDFTLPDYQSEIKRLLSTRVTLSSPNEYVGNSNAMAEGALTYRVIYLGVDGKLYCATLEDKYSFSAPLEFTADFVNTALQFSACSYRQKRIACFCSVLRHTIAKFLKRTLA